jgi:DNA primase
MILELCRAYVRLSPETLRGDCPFCKGKGTFFVFAQRETWRCFGSCAVGGDAVSFVKRVDQNGLEPFA